MNPGTAPSIYSLQEKNVKSSRAIIANNVLPDKEMVLAPKFVPFHKLDSCTGFIAMRATSAGGGEPLFEVVEQAIDGSLDGHCTHLSSLGGSNAFNHHIDSRGERSTAVATYALKLHQTCIVLQQLFHQLTA
ncbi:hypothetical protein I315_05147 [Cryptococcus gattii Ru294]|nr:hypothetical protein I315_05147 [Cryptococcus gattii Ru294]